MRRMFASFAVASVGAAVLGALPASAQEAPVVIVTEGVGRVCGSAQLTQAEANLYGTQKPGTTADNKEAWCRYDGSEKADAPVNVVKAIYDTTDTAGVTPDPVRNWKRWWQPGYGDGSKFQGLFLPGVGPGAVGPYSLTIVGGLNPPGNACVDSIEGPGCSTRLVGKLTKAPTNGFGAHAGSSQGTGTFTFSSATGQQVNRGVLGWNNSAATVLPLEGEVTAGDGAGSQIVGFSSSRGVTGDSSAGNAGVQEPTTGFQTEGMIVVYDV